MGWARVRFGAGFPVVDRLERNRIVTDVVNCWLCLGCHVASHSIGCTRRNALGVSGCSRLLRDASRVVKLTPCDDAVTLRRLLPGDTLRRLPGGVPLPADRRPSSMLRLLILPFPASASTAAGKSSCGSPGAEAEHSVRQTNSLQCTCGVQLRTEEMQVNFVDTTEPFAVRETMVQSSLTQLRLPGEGQSSAPVALCCSLTGSSPGFPFW